MRHLGNQLDPQSRTHAADGLEARVCIGAQGLVQRLAGHARRLGDLGHAARTRDRPQRIGEPALTIPAPGAGPYATRVRAIDPDGVASPWSAVQTLSHHYVLPWRLSAPAGPGH